MMDKISLNHPAIQGDVERARRVIEHRTQQRAIRHGLPALALAIGLLAAGWFAGHAVAMNEAQSADWTVPQCSVYADDSTPDLPPFTRTDVCATNLPNGQVDLSYTDGRTTTVTVEGTR